jgi:hypothetical protein
MSERIALSASRIKTAKSCSWLYWTKYKLKLPDKGNSGASRGTVCHEVFELLGDPAHKKEFNKIIKKQDVFASEKVKDLIVTLAKKEGVNDQENLEQIKVMTLNGLNYDFFGEAFGKITESFSEKDFDIEVNDGDLNYKIKGFIDKLFIYNNKAIIRDFKSSKEIFKGKDLEDNMQDLMYVLAVKKIFPQVKELYSEFLFLKFDLKTKGTVKMPTLTDEELNGFEQYLTYVQNYLDNFDEKSALSNLAAKADFAKDDSFSGPLLCGRAKSPDQLKKDGTPMWHCPSKFGFRYYQIVESGKIIDSCFEEDIEKYEEKYKDKNVEFNWREYGGCPAHCK